MNILQFVERNALYPSKGREICNILTHIAIEKTPEITYNETSNPSEPGCLRQKWIFDKSANFPRGQFHTRRLRNCHNAAVCSRLGGVGCAGTREARQ
jgi:hypothetical protein